MKAGSYEIIDGKRVLQHRTQPPSAASVKPDIKPKDSSESKPKRTRRTKRG